jgi:hypothetical protein
MSTQIPVEFVDQYKANILLLSQQKQSKLRQICRMEDMTGDAMFVERIAATSMTQITDDKLDKLKLLADPQSTYVVNAVAAANRQIDDIIITALGGPAYAGHTGGTTVNNYDSGECRLIASDGTIVAAGSDHTNTTETALTISKLLTCKQLLDDAEIDDERQRYFITNPYNINAMLNTTEVKSSDYNTVKALAMGQLDTFMGFKFIKTTRLSADGTDTGATNCYACAQGAIVLSVALEPEVKIDQLPTKRYTTQVYVSQSMGATRVEGPAVVEINLDTA